MHPALTLRPIAPLALVFCTACFAAAPVRTAELTEGPFYTFAANNTLPTLTPANRDNDLTKVEGGSGTAKGTLFLLSGTVRDLSGKPVPGAKVELWQTDDGGVYYHSGDRNAPNRDQNFQHYGETTSDAQGRYSFRTVNPGLYTGRIRHFHFKVKQGDATVLTSQFIFEDQRADFSRDGVTTRVTGDALETMVLTPQRGTDSSGAPALLATKDIVIDPTRRSGSQRGAGDGPARGKTATK
jgi:protocatechuate 3,4-dioxygenase, beta subunit